MDYQKVKKKINKKIVLGIIGIIIILLIASRIISVKNEQVPETLDTSIKVKTTEVKKMDLEIMTPLSGKIKPIEEASIVPMVAGKVTKVHVDLGTKVTKGTTLFELDKDQMQNTYNQALAGYNQANAAYLNAKSNLERTEYLYNEGAVSKQQYEQIQLSYTSAYQALTQSQSALNNAKEALDNCIVTSPIDGYVTLVNINEGEVASQAMPAVIVANIDVVELETSVSEYLINKINIGDTVKVLVSSASNQEFDGIITALSPAPAPNSLTYPLKVSIDNSDSVIKSGMFAEIKIISENKKNVLVVPSDAVIIKSGQSSVAVLKGKTATFKKVTTGLDNGEYIEITNGLTEGEIIITEGQYYLDEGSQVTVVN